MITRNHGILTNIWQFEGLPMKVSSTYLVSTPAWRLVSIQQEEKLQFLVKMPGWLSKSFYLQKIIKACYEVINNWDNAWLHFTSVSHTSFGRKSNYARIRDILTIAHLKQYEFGNEIITNNAAISHRQWCY